MKVLPVIIEKFAKYRVGGVVFESAKRITESLDNKDLSNEEKKAIAVGQLKAYGYELTGFLFNLAIELAVDYLRAKAK